MYRDGQIVRVRRIYHGHDRVDPYDPPPGTYMQFEGKWAGNTYDDDRTPAAWRFVIIGAKKAQQLNDGWGITEGQYWLYPEDFDHLHPDEELRLQAIVQLYGLDPTGQPIEMDV